MVAEDRFRVEAISHNSPSQKPSQTHVSMYKQTQIKSKSVKLLVEALESQAHVQQPPLTTLWQDHQDQWDQQAQQAENQLLTIRIRAQQAVATANGTANSIKLIENQLERSPNYLKYYALQKWNGILPQVTGQGGIPLIDVRNITK